MAQLQRERPVRWFVHAAITRRFAGGRWLHARRLQHQQRLVGRTGASDSCYSHPLHRLHVHPPLRWQADRQLQEDLSPPLALAFLANKLIAYSLLHDRVPIVGRSYASQYLALKLASLERQKQSALPLLPRRFSAFTAIASGCSLPFVSDQALAELEFARLDEFKKRHEPLRKQHQLYLLEATRALKDAGSGPELEERIAAIQMEVEKKRLDLTRETKEAWLAAGLDIAKKAAVGSFGGLTAGFALVHRASLADLLVASVPGLKSSTSMDQSWSGSAGMTLWSLRPRFVNTISVPEALSRFFSFMRTVAELRPPREYSVFRTTQGFLSCMMTLPLTITVCTSLARVEYSRLAAMLYCGC